MVHWITELHIFKWTNRTDDQQVIHTHVRLVRGVIESNFFFLTDNSRPHIIHVVDELLVCKDITRTYCYPV